MKYSIQSFAAALLLTGLTIPMASYALGTDRAKGTQVKAPEKSVQVEQCLACHQPVKKLHDRGAHRDVNCGSCHTVPANHTTAPSAKTRPATRFDYASCSQCHGDQHKELLDPKYHYEWAEKGGNPVYSFIKDTAGDNWPLEIQYRLPRFHAGLMTDFMANRSNGRYQYKDKRDQGSPQEFHWDVLYDSKPELGDTVDGDIVGLGWRPHKGREVTNQSRCLVCKTTENMLEYQTGYTKNPQGMDLQSPIVPTYNKTHTGFNCNFCHDPHSAPPRIVVDPIIESMVGKGGNNQYQMNAGKTGTPKLEVVEMGVRGFKRRIGILERYNANFMCGQCHNAALRYKVQIRTDSTGKAVTDEELDKYSVAPYATEFFSTPLQAFNTFKARGWNQGTDAATGTRKYMSDVHAQLETLPFTKHGQAGVGCTDCHFAKKPNGQLEHQPSLPRLKVANTCMRSECHGPGSKSNWTRPGQALYTIETIQQEYRIRTGKMEQEGRKARALLIQVKKGEIQLPEAQVNALKDAFGQHIATRDFYLSDYSKGMHDPTNFNLVASKVIRDLRKAIADANKAAVKVEKK